MNDQNDPAPVPATPVVASATPATVPPIARLPKHLQQMLSWLPQADWPFIVARVCHLPFTRDLADVVAFVDRVWTFASRAEHRTGKSRITGAEMDIFRARYEDGAKEILSVAAELAQRAGLTEMLARNRRLLTRFGIQMGRPAESDAAAAGAEVVDPTTEAA